MPGQSGCKSRSRRRRFARKSETLETPDGSCEGAPAVELLEVAKGNRDVSWRGLIELAGGRGGLVRTRDALDGPDAIPACLMPVKDGSTVGLAEACRRDGPFHCLHVSMFWY